MSDEIEEPTCDFDSCCPHYPYVVKLLEREQKCVELAVEALEKIKNPEPLQYHWAVAENAITKIKSLREMK